MKKGKVKYRMLKKDEWIYQSKGDERLFSNGIWALTGNGDKRFRVEDTHGYGSLRTKYAIYRRPLKVRPHVKG